MKSQHKKPHKEREIQIARAIHPLKVWEHILHQD